ncbi:lactonase family protein [Sporobolomyces salmoneus]|uniref:lactonase family protein n=1 Tax=Sporobolomyces salmoneus TaxID=183962 RepID=UPI003170633A
MLSSGFAVSTSATSLLAATSSSSSTCARLHYLLSGTFNTVFLYLLAFSPYTQPPTLEIVRKYRAEGPHQFLALNEQRDRVYATTWAQPPTLSSWRVLDQGRDGIEKINTVGISSTGSYLAVLPSEVAASLELDSSRLYQAGGPVAQTFSISPSTGAIDEQLQEVIYLDGGAEELWDSKTDRTRVALRYGSHAIDVDPVLRRAYVPHVGRDSIFVYAFNADGTLDELAEVTTFGDKGHEGPRHSVPSRDGKKLYVVTEHTSYLDVYNVEAGAPYLTHSQRLSVIPSSLHNVRKQYRGDTLRISRDGKRLYVTTRGKTTAEKGFVSVWKIASDGSIIDDTTAQEETEGYGAIYRFETRTSGGKANAVEIFPFQFEDESRDWIVLTDDEDGWVSVLEWKEEERELVEVASVQLGAQEGKEPDEAGTGASHAVWLS